MITVLKIAPQLTRAEVWARLAVSCGIAAALLGVRYVDPETVSWFPLRTSCGAFTGLPCIFCGTTRGLHYLLNGDFTRAFYFNWLAFPVVAVGVAAVVAAVAEIAAQRRLVAARFTFRATPTSIAWTGGSLAALWLLQVSIAISLHKHELLNPTGPLYPWFVK